MENVLKKLIAQYPERNIKVLAGRELVAEKKAHEPFIKIKTVHCNRCGECCMSAPNTVYGNDDEEKCNVLIKYGDTWECGAGMEVPYFCLDDPSDLPQCCIKYRKVGVK